MEPLLSVENLRTEFRTRQGPVRAVDDLTLSVAPGETLAIVGESGSGKSVTALSIMGLVPIERGRIRFGGRNLAECTPEEMRAIRGRDIAMIFQDPLTSLNPLMRVGAQIEEALRAHAAMDARAARRRAVELLEQVRIADPARRAGEYPHQLSGGMRQRVMIAIALANHPRLLIADEPTTALDVTVEAQILDLIGILKREVGMAVMLITHDLSVVAEVADRVVVMYAGRKVEEGGAAQVLAAPRHPYTQGLMASIPRTRAPGEPRGRLPEMPGTVPALTALPPGCAFQNRCPQVIDVCRTQPPAMVELAPAHRAACYRAESREPAR